MTDPIRPTDDEARALARSLLSGATFAALGTIEPGTDMPMVTRIALATLPDGAPLTLVSELAQHAKALAARPACSLLVGEPGAKGDPLTHPRLTLQCTAQPLRPGDPGAAEAAAHYLALRPKARLYAGFADFFHVRFRIERAFLNGGFGRAFVLGPGDFAPRP